MTAQDQEEDEAKSTLRVEFGVSVLEWLEFGEEPEFKSLHDEIVNHPKSTISGKLYLGFAQECFMKMIGRKKDQYELEELLSLKLYSDTDKYQSLLRKASWRSSSKATKRSFYQWAMRLYSTALFHAKPIPRWRHNDKSPVPIYHGLNAVFVVDQNVPVYNGPLSTTVDQNVAASFSGGTGLLWTIQAQYYNRFKFVVGISMSWISHYSNEQEVLLINQYLPIISAKNFDDAIENNVDHLLESLRVYKAAISDRDKFYSIIGLQRQPEWMAILQSRRLSLYETTDIGCTLLERLVGELRLDLFTDEYNILRSKMQIHVFAAFNMYTFSLNSKMAATSTQYKIVFGDSDETERRIDCKALQFHQWNTQHTAGQIFVSSCALFGCDKYIKLQDVDDEQLGGSAQTRDLYEHLTVRGSLIILSEGYEPSGEHLEQIQNSKFVLLYDTHELQLKSRRIFFDQHCVFQFHDLRDIHFIIPYSDAPQTLNLYVQFQEHYDFVLFKQFSIEQRQANGGIPDEVDYLLQLLKAFSFPFSSSKAFFQQTGVSITCEHLAVMINHELLLDYHDLNVLTTLVQQLNVEALSDLLQERQQHEKEQMVNTEESCEDILEEMGLKRKNSSSMSDYPSTSLGLNMSATSPTSLQSRASNISGSETFSFAAGAFDFMDIMNAQFQRKSPVERFADYAVKVHEAANERYWMKVKTRLLEHDGVQNLLPHMCSNFTDEKAQDNDAASLDKKAFTKQAKRVYKVDVKRFYTELFQDITNAALDFDTDFDRKSAIKWLVRYELKKLRHVIVEKSITAEKFKAYEKDIFCNQHVGFLPKKRRNVLYKKLQKDISKGKLESNRMQTSTSWEEDDIAKPQVNLRNLNLI